MQNKLQQRSLLLGGLATMVLLVAAPLPAQAVNIVVVTTDDDVVNPLDGLISLREAFDIANSDADDTVVKLASNTAYQLTLCGPPGGEDNNADGDLDHTADEDLAVIGAGGTSIHTACPGDRLIHSLSDAAFLTLHRLDLHGGEVLSVGEVGGAVWTLGPALVTSCSIFNNQAQSGGGIFGGDPGFGGIQLRVHKGYIGQNTGGGIAVTEFGGDVEVHKSAIVDNTGTGVFISFGGMIVTNSTVAGNTNVGISGVDGSPMIVKGCSVYNNGGGGIRTTGQVSSELTVDESYVAGNGGVGGISCSFCLDVTITRSTIANNTAEFGWGGGITIIAGIPFGLERQDIVLSKVLIKNNSAPDGGGGLGVIDGEDFGPTDTPPNVRITDATFVNNFTDREGPGGAIHMRVGDLAIKRALFAHNVAGLPDESAVAQGGAIYFVGRTLLVQHTTIKKNAAEYHGGGVSATATDASTFEYVQFQANDSAEGAGGGLYLRGGTAFVQRSSFLHNTTPLTGGGISVAEDFEQNPQPLFIDASTFAGNFAGIGGGALRYQVTDGFVQIINSTLHNNQAGFQGGGLVVGGASLLQMLFTTVTANESPNGANFFQGGGEFEALANAFGEPVTGVDCFLGGIVTSFGYNTDSDGSCDFDDVNDLGSITDLELGPLNNNGGPTLTRLPMAGSPLLNTVPPVDCTVDVDQRGVSRPQGPACDTGSVERNGKFTHKRPKDHPRHKPTKHMRR